MQKLKEKIFTYFEKIDEKVFPKKFKKHATIILSGSAGWGIQEGYDEKADWDFHILLSNKDYLEFTKEYGENYVIDDHKNTPIVFCQIHNKSWLLTRLKEKKTKILYLWIYTNCLYLQDYLNLYINEIKKEKDFFIKNINNFIKEHYIKFAVRRLDTSSCAKRGLNVAMSINKAEMIKTLLELLSLLKGFPYPYTKWLFKHVEIIYPHDGDIRKILELTKKLVQENSISKNIILLKELKLEVENLLQKQCGKERWIEYWWEFNKN